MKTLKDNLIILGLIIFSSFATPTFAQELHALFCASEHLFMGEKVNVYFSTQPQQNPLLHLPNGLTVTYGDIIPLGDLYGVPDNAISKGKSKAEREERFMAAFNSLAKQDAAVSEAASILAIIHAEEKSVLQAIAQGQQPEEIYQQLGEESSREFNCLTGGGCNKLDWWLFPGRYLKLANDNFDHFSDNAWSAYSTGHELALRVAAAAHADRDQKQLELAYAMNAFASHFLSDRFSAGHLRTPRNELPEHVSPSIAGSLLAAYMHNEESAAGLHVSNARGEAWVSYGDRSFLSTKNAANSDLVLAALQQSANEIFDAYQSGSETIPDGVASYIPIPSEVNDESRNDISPLFYWDNKKQKVMRRVDMENIYDKHWTDSWWGWSTLLALRRERGASKSIAAAKMNSPYHQ